VSGGGEEFDAHVTRVLRDEDDECHAKQHRHDDARPRGRRTSVLVTFGPFLRTNPSTFGHFVVTTDVSSPLEGAPDCRLGLVVAGSTHFNAQSLESTAARRMKFERQPVKANRLIEKEEFSDGLLTVQSVNALHVEP